MSKLQQANAYVSARAPQIANIFRPKHHFAAPAGWINDPNGFVYYKGEYHLFYQSHPYGDEWGPMHWGHAKSKDLLHWQDLPIALAPDQDYDLDGCFSGTALVVGDRLYVMYTGVSQLDGRVRQIQCLAYTDDGENFTKVDQNPVIAEDNMPANADTVDFRDPKILEHAGKYYAICASKELGPDLKGTLLIFESSDLLHWSKGRVMLTAPDGLGTIWECPDLIEGEDEDYLIISPIGMKADGDRFVNDHSTIWVSGKMDWDKLEFELDQYDELDSGLDFYAAESTAGANGERVMISWENMWGRDNLQHQLNLGWSGIMTIPRKLIFENGRVLQAQADETKALKRRVNLAYLSDFDELDLTGVDELSITRPAGKVTLRLGNGQGEATIDWDETGLTFNRAGLGAKIDGADHINARHVDVEASELLIQLDTSAIDLLIGGRALSNTYFALPAINHLEVQSDQQLRVESYQYDEGQTQHK